MGHASDEQRAMLRMLYIASPSGMLLYEEHMHTIANTHSKGIHPNRLIRSQSV